jgi:hypothetical protein
MRRQIGEWLVSAGAVALLVVAIIVIYNPVPDEVTSRMVKHPAAEVSSVVQNVHSQTRSVASVVRERTRAHTELVTFAMAAAILFGLMLRS